MRKALIAVAMIAAASVAACTEAGNARTFNYGQTGRVTCHTGGVVVFDDFSTGRIEKHESSDGFYFVSTTSGRLSEVTGDCIIDYGVSPGPGFKPIRP